MWWQRIADTWLRHAVILDSSTLRTALLALFISSLVLNVLAHPDVAAAASGTQGLQYGAVINDQGTILLTDEALDKLAASGAGWLRINFRLGTGYFLDWTDTTAHGYSALSVYDTIVSHARSRGLKILGELSNEAWNGWLS